MLPFETLDPNDPRRLPPGAIPGQTVQEMPGVAPPVLAVGEGGGSPIPPAAPSAPMVNPMGMALPEETHTRGGVGPSTSTVIPTAAAAIASGQADTAAELRADAAKREGASKAAVLGEEAKGSALQAADQAQLLADRRAAVAAHQAQVAALNAEGEKRRQQMEKDAHPTTYWEDKGAASKVLSAFLVGLSTYAHLRGGGQGPGPAYQVLKEQMDLDRKTKLEKYQASKEFHALVAKDQEAARAALADKLKQIDDEHVVSGKMIADTVQAAAKKAAMPGAQAEADKFAAQVEQDRAENRQKEAQHNEVKVESGHASWSDTQNVNKGANAQAKPDLTALTEDGKPYGLWRTLAEAEKGRTAQTALAEMRSTLAALNEHQQKHGNIVNPLNPEYAKREALVAAASRPLQALNEAGILNPGELKNNIKALDTSWRKGGDEAAAANDILMNSVSNKYDARLKGQAIRADVTQAVTAAGVPQARPAAPAAASPQVSAARKWLASPEAKKDPRKAAEVAKRLMQLGDGS